MSEICAEIVTKVTKGEDGVRTLIKKLPKQEIPQLITALKNLQKRELERFIVYADLLRKAKDTTSTVEEVEEDILKELKNYRSLSERVRSVIALF